MSQPHHPQTPVAAAHAHGEMPATLVDQPHVLPHDEPHGHGHGHGHGEGEFSHPAPVWMLLAVFFALLFLTWLTVYQSTWDLGGAEIYVSLFIATIKAGLVILFFMHMLWDKLINFVIFFSSLIFVALFLGATLTDAWHYKDHIIDVDTLPQSIPQAPAAGDAAAH